MYHRTGTVSFLLSGPQTISVHRAAAVPGKQLHAASRNRQPDPFQQIYSAVMSESVKVSLGDFTVLDVDLQEFINVLSVDFRSVNIVVDFGIIHLTVQNCLSILHVQSSDLACILKRGSGQKAFPDQQAALCGSVNTICQEARGSVFF